MVHRAVGLVLFALIVAWSVSVRAFVGFYVVRGEGAPESRATTVVLLRDGGRTVVSVRAEYRGPAKDLALVLPVPASVSADDVRALRPDAFERIERVSAPRLVEFRERDPCATVAVRGSGPGGPVDTGMTPEARLAPNPYDVVVLAPDDAAQLARWLRTRGYRPPDGLDAMVQSYVESGWRFLIARLDASNVSFVDGRAVLSPLRFHFRSDQVVLPIRFARGDRDRPHDLVIHVLARRRMESANRDDVLVPTNLVALPPARQRLGEVYATILDRVFRRHPDALVTEYAWDASDCDRCTAPLGPTDLTTFGTDAIPGTAPDDRVLTRLHAWIDERPGSDLTLEPGRPVAGGRGRPRGADRLNERVDRRADENAFQARYAILRPWRGPALCAAPARGRWSPATGRRRPSAVATPPVTTIIPTGRLRRYLHSWAPVLRIPVRGDALSTTAP